MQHEGWWQDKGLLNFFLVAIHILKKPTHLRNTKNLQKQSLLVSICIIHFSNLNRMQLLPRACRYGVMHTNIMSC